MPGDLIITPQEVGISSSKNNSQKRGKEMEHVEERKSQRKQPSQKSRG